MDPALEELLRTGSDNDAEEVEAIIRLDHPQVEIPGVRIVSRFGPIVTCRLRRDAILETWQQEDVRSVKAARVYGPPDEPEGMNTTLNLPLTPVHGDERRPFGLPLTGAGIVIGIVDSGCDFAAPSFRNADGSTRLIALWDQRGRPSPDAPNYYGYGTFYGRRQINRALSHADPYGALGYHPADADRGRVGAHGTHVMDIAAGNGRGGGPVGVAPETDLIFVELANSGTAGLANFGNSARLLEGFDFIARTAGPRPWVVNLSVGNCGGPHDGRTLVEMAFDFALQAAPGRFMAQSGGNYFDKRVHASGRLQAGQTRTLSLLVDEADITPNELEVWYAGGDAFAVRTASPTGAPSPWVRLGEQADVIENGRIVGRIYNRALDPNNKDNVIDIFLYTNAPPGWWTVTLKAETVSDGVFHAWLEKDVACRECQPCFSAFDAESFYTTGTIANGRMPLVVGAYDAHSPSREVAPFSSVGPTRDGRCKPDLVAPGVGVLAARSAPRGWHTNANVRKSGTSMAAPEVTGAVALCLQGARRPLWSHEIRELILSNTDPVAAHVKNPLRYGHGYLNVAKVVAAVLALSPRVATSPASRLIGAKEHASRPKERQMKPNAAGHFDRLERVITGATSRAASERDLLVEIMGANGAPYPLYAPDPDALYRAIAFRRHGPLAALIKERFAVLARAGETPTSPPRAGDVLLRVAPGQPGLGHVAVISDATLWPSEQLAKAPFRSESQRPGFYALVIEAGDRRFRHTRLDPFARCVLDAAGRMPPYQQLLRPTSPVGVSTLSSSLTSESPFLHPNPEAFVEEVLGKDERTLVTDALVTPNRWICAIDIWIDNPKRGRPGEPQFISKSRATGILIGPRYILTAAHILGKQTIEVDGEKKSVEVKGLTVSPARHGSNSNTPFGKVKSKAVRVSQPYRIRRQVRQGSKVIEIPVQQHDDYALIILEKDLAASTHSKMHGVLGYWGHDPTVAVVRRLEPDDLKGKEVVVIGYPGDTCGKDKFSGSKSEKETKIVNCWNRRNDEWASTQWRGVGTLQVEANSTTVFHTADTYEGQSGAPICLSLDQKLHLVGIHTDSDNPQRNQGVRVTRRMLRELCAWMNADAGDPIATIQDDTLMLQPKSSSAGAKEFVDGFVEDESQAEDFLDTLDRLSESSLDNEQEWEHLELETEVFSTEDLGCKLDSAGQSESEEPIRVDQSPDILVELAESSLEGESRGDEEDTHFPFLEEFEPETTAPFDGVVDALYEELEETAPVPVTYSVGSFVPARQFVDMPLTYEDFIRNREGTGVVIQRIRCHTLADVVAAARPPMPIDRVTVGMPPVTFERLVRHEDLITSLSAVPMLWRTTPSGALQAALDLVICHPADPAHLDRLPSGRRAFPLAVICHGNHKVCDTTTTGAPGPLTPPTGAGLPTRTFPSATFGVEVTSHHGYSAVTRGRPPGVTTGPATVPYLQEELATHGIISVSVSHNPANYFNLLLETRADLVLKAVAEMRRLNADRTSRFHNRVDFDKVAFIGHSRGGDAIIRAALKQRSLNVRALVQLAPTDITGLLAGSAPTGVVGGRTDVVTSPMRVTADLEAFHLILYGSRDGDVSGLEDVRTSAFGDPFRHYDRSSAHRSFMFWHDANHSRFNRFWEDDDEGTRVPAHPHPFVGSLATLLPRPDHEARTRESVGACLRFVLNREAGEAERLNGRVLTTIAPTRRITAMWKFGRNLKTLDRFEDARADRNTLGGRNVLPAGSLLDEIRLANENPPGAGMTAFQFMHIDRVLRASLPATPLPGAAGTAGAVSSGSWRAQIPPGDQNFSGFDLLTLRVTKKFDPAAITAALVPGGTPPALMPQIRVRLIGSGTTRWEELARGPLSGLPALRRVTLSAGALGTGASGPVPPSATPLDLTKFHLETWEVALSSFSPHVNLNRVVAVEIEMIGKGGEPVYVDTISLVRL